MKSSGECDGGGVCGCGLVVLIHYLSTERFGGINLLLTYCDEVCNEGDELYDRTMEGNPDPQPVSKASSICILGLYCSQTRHQPCAAMTTKLEIDQLKSDAERRRWQ